MSSSVMEIKGFITKHRFILLIGFLELVYITGYGLIWFVLPLISEDITKDVMLVGLLIAFPTFISMLFAIPVGGFSDKFGRKKPIILGALMMVALGLFLPAVKSLTSFIVFGFLLGVIHQLFNTPIKAYIMDISPKGKTAEYFGVYSTSFSIGLALGSVAGGFLLANNLIAGVQRMSYFYTTIGILALAIALILKETVKLSTEGSVKIAESLRGDQLLIKGLLEYKKLGSIGLLVLYLTFIIYFGPGMTWTIEPLYNKLGMDSNMLGLILGMFVIPLILFTIPAGYLADKYGKTKMLIPGLLIGGSFLIAFGSTMDPIFLLLFAFISTTGFAFVWTSTNGLLADLSAGHRKGGIAGVWNIFEDLGYIVGPVFGGFSAGVFNSLQVPFILFGLIVIASVMPVFIVTKKVKINPSTK